MKKILMAILCVAMACGIGVAAVGCGGEKMSDTIAVITRESGSGTRGAFIELTGVEQKNAEGKKVDRTVSTAEVANATSVVLQKVLDNPSAIGYISLGSLNDKVKAVPFEGVEATVANIERGNTRFPDRSTLRIKRTTTMRRLRISSHSSRARM